MEKAEEIVGQKVYIDPADYSELSEEEPLSEEDITLEDLVGFTLVDQNNTRIGIISYVHDFSGNICMELEETESYIPFHDELLLGIDIETRTISLEISEGLI